MRAWSEKYVDWMHYTVPLKSGIAAGYEFPADYVGQYGTFDAVKHIYANSHLKDLISKDGGELYVSKRYFATETEKAIQDIRSQWRQKQGLSEDNTLIFVAPGNELEEATFCAQNIRKGVKEFLLKYSAPTSMSPKARPVDNFVTVISTHAGSEGEKYMKDFVKNSEWLGRVMFVDNTDNEHLNAMCASDLGIVYNGQMISSAAACHLPTMNLMEMRMHHQWYNDLFNRWWNDMNIIADRGVYPEIIGGEAWFGKIADTLADWYIKPDTRYQMIRNFDSFVQEAMPYKPIDRTQVRTRDIILADGNAYDVYMDPMQVVAKKMWQDASAYESPVDCSFKADIA